MYDSVNSMIGDKIEGKFGKLSRTTGKKHTFFGIVIKFIGGNKVAVSTTQYIDEDI